MIDNFKSKIDLLMTNLSLIKQLVQAHESGEIYLTWKGPAMKMKFVQWMDADTRLDKSEGKSLE